MDTPSSASKPTISSPYSMTSADRNRRPTGAPITSPIHSSLNDRLNTNYVNVDEHDSSCGAHLTRSITGCVGLCVSPRTLLVVLRVLKAVTFSFLMLTLAADLMYIIFLEIVGRKEVHELAGGRRDLIIRIYGFFLALVALCIEIDYAPIVKSVHGFKRFVPRSLLLFFISAITGTHPLHANETDVQSDDSVADDAYYYDEVALLESQIPQSVVNFQMVTSFVIGLCAIAYFVFGCLCFDRFTAKAFLSTNDPLVSTSIPTPLHHLEAVPEDGKELRYQSPQN